MRFKILLILIFVLALSLRIYDLGNIPDGLHIDELNAGYQGYKIVKTGSDLFGNKLPFYIDRFGDYRPAGIFYISGLSVFLFGLDTFSIRLPVALIGALTTIPVYFLSLLIFKKRLISLFSALFLAISPWHIVTSRATSESIVALFLIICGVTLLISAFIKGKKKLIFAVFVVLLLSYFFYHTPRIFIPVLLLFLLPVFYILKKQKMVKLKNKYLLILIVAFFVISALLGFTNFGKGRFEQTSIFGKQEILTKIKDLEDGEQGNVVLARIFHNKPLVFTKAIFDEYLSYFSTEFLFIKGGLPDRYAVNDVGLLYYLEFLLLLLGIMFIARQKVALTLVPIIWLIGGPIAASLTIEDTPNVQRAIFMLPSFQIIEACGLYLLFGAQSLKVRKIFATGVSLIFIISIIYFLHQYFVHKTTHVSFARNEGNEKLFSYLFSRENEFSKVFLPVYEDLPMYYIFFKKDKSNFLSVKRSEYNKEVSMGKYTFVPYICPVKIFEARSLGKGERVLVVQDPRCRDNPRALKYITTIERQDRTSAYTVNEYFNE